MFRKRAAAVCEQTEDAVGVDGVVLDGVGRERAAVPQNTCCGATLSAAPTVGPFLKYWGMEPLPAGAAPPAAAAPPRVWLGSLLLVTKAPTREVVVEVLDAQGAPRQQLVAEELDAYKGWTALRFRLKLAVTAQEQKIEYTVSVSGRALQPAGGGAYNFYIAGSEQPTHWGYYSCSGFTDDVPAQKREEHWGGTKPMWEDVRKVHEKKPLHLLVGGGDQLYNDDVWKLPALKRFLDMPRKTEQERAARHAAEFADDMKAEVDGYYFHHYATHFSLDVIGDVYARVPQIMSWDDHDIFDGWGSYPPYLQTSTVFKGVFEQANRWYCVFQQHCRPSEKVPVEVYELGGRTAVVLCDQRHRRRPDQILPLEHYMNITMLCTTLPKHVEHVVFVFTVPVVYPHIRGAQSVLSLVANGCVLGMLGKLGISPMNHFGEPELMDDLDDHWTAPSHHEERRFLIEQLQMLAKYRGCRVTLISGDVHVCGAGHLISSPAPPTDAELRHDFRYMPQIVSSAIANPPPPSGLMKVLESFSAGGHINKHTKHTMKRKMLNAAGIGKPLENKRNWCEVTENAVHDPSNPSWPMAGGLMFDLRVEHEAPQGGKARHAGRVDVTRIEVPALEPHTPGMDDYFDVRSVKLVQRGCFRWC